MMRGFFTTLSTKKAFFIIIFLGFFVYFNSLNNAFFGDDYFNLVNNPSVHSISNIKTLFSEGLFPNRGTGQENNYYRPMVSVIFSLVYFFSGANPFGFHLFSLLVHIANTILLFAILRYFFRKEISFLFSLLFLVHPFNVETVVYVAALQELLFLFFGLLALFLAITRSGKKYISLIISFLLFLSLLSKETGFAFLILIPFFSYLYQSRKLLIKSIIQSLSAVIAYLFLRLEVAHISFGVSQAIVLIQTLSLLERSINVPKIMFFYIKTFFYPFDLVEFQDWVVRRINFTDFYLPLFLDISFILILSSIGWILQKKNRDLFKVFLFFSAWFFVGLFIHLQIFPLDETVSDRWFYFTIIGLLGILGVAVQYFELNLFKRKFLLICFCIVVIFLISLRSFIRSSDWKTPASLFYHDIRINKDSYQLEIGLAGILLDQGLNNEAHEHYLRAVSLFPGYVTYNNLGLFYLVNHQAAEATTTFAKSLTYGNFANTYMLLSLLSVSKDDPKIAEAHIKSYLKKYPNYDELLFYLAISKYKAGDKDAAINDAKKAYSIFPSASNAGLIKLIENDEPISLPSL